MKAILEFDVPESCMDCRLQDNDCMCHAINQAEHTDSDSYFRRSTFCPLRIVIPELREIYLEVNK